MSDVVVTVPRTFGLANWIAEGDAAILNPEWSGTLWRFSTWGPRPDIIPGERVYVVYNNRLRGYAPLVWLDWRGGRGGDFIRGGGAVAVTIDEPIRGFRGWRYRWWEQEMERPFPDWWKE